MPDHQSVAGDYHVVPRSALGSTDLSAKILPPAKAAPALKSAEPIENFADVDHVTVNRGPRIDWIEQVTGPLARTRVEDLVSTHGLGHSIATPEPSGSTVGSIEEPSRQESRTHVPAPTPAEFKKAAEGAAQQARTLMKQKQQAPEVIPRILVTDAPLRPAGPLPRPGFKPARRDTVH